MSNGLDVLKQHRDALLLAEVAAWLHDMGKCADAFLQPDGAGFYAVACQGQPRVNPHKAIFEPVELGQLPYWSSLSPRRGQCSRLEEANHTTALWRTLKYLAIDLHSLDDVVSLPGFGLATVRELVLWGRPLVSEQIQQFRSILGASADTAAFLGRAHGASHIEKEESGGAPSLFLSTPFGFEYAKLEDLNTKLREVLISVVSPSVNRKDIVTQLKAQWGRALGDTRYPENEVTLWDWSGTVAALYKASLAGAMLGFQPQPADLRWRLLSVRFDGLSFLASVSRLPDLLARKVVLDDALNRVRQLLEEQYPLGTEVFRDENGSVFVVPGCEKTNCSLDILTLQDSNSALLAELLRCAVWGAQWLDLQGEMRPVIKLDLMPWWGQDPRQAGNDEIPPVGEHLKDVTSPADPQWAAEQWQSATADICSVCALRPQAPPNSKAGQRKVCEVCEQRREDRAEQWASNLTTTIWTDEVADDNGRLALVVGQFELERWLDGTQVQALTVTDPAQDSSPNKANVARKNPSFARIRRVWETTRTFWQEISDRLGASVGTGAARLEIRPQSDDKLDLGQFHTYELLVNGIRLSVVWDGDHHRFITCDNLNYLAKPEQLGTQVADVVKRGRTFPLEEPVGYGGANRRLGTITVAQEVATLPEVYTPAIPILAEPRTFMALVPANKALDVVQAIKRKYETEMGKVRNRLPLTVGVVYAGRRTPLATLLDAGRRMLRRPCQTVKAEVRKLTPLNPLPDGWPGRVDVKLRLGEREIVVGVPTVMGDGTTPDVWYPYWQVAGRPTDRNRWFVGPDGEHWVHVCNLRPGDTVAFTSSTFDFEYLDVSSRRFEVAYGDDGRRLGKGKRQRPYLLEQVSDLKDAWQQISRLATSQIKGVEALIEAKRRDWGEPTGMLDVSPAFRQFVGDVLHEAEAHSEALEQAAIAGLLADALEIHLTIHKDKPQPKEA